MFWQPFFSLQLRPTQVFVVVHNTASHCNCILPTAQDLGLSCISRQESRRSCAQAPLASSPGFWSWLRKSSGERDFLAPCMPVPCAPLECKLLRQIQTFPFGFNLLRHVKIPSIFSAARFYHKEVNENTAVH